jgi:pimeloyl-ACP methyl ester carboxylesterase
MTCKVAGRPTRYGLVAGDGPTAVFLHGWGLGYHSYAQPLRALGAEGWTVIAPDLPGFGGTSDLALKGVSFAELARFVNELLVELEVNEPVRIVGHSFGGGVAIQFAHDFPARIDSAVLLDAVSGATWVRSSARSQPMSTRPFWDWGAHLLRELPIVDAPVIVPTIIREVAWNLVRHPGSLSIAADLARSADLRDQLAVLAARGVNVRAVWGTGDHIVTRASFDDQCAALGCAGELVHGSHSWPMSAPSLFAAAASGASLSVTAALSDAG